MRNYITVKNTATGETKKIPIPSGFVDGWVWGSTSGSNHKQATERLKKLGTIKNGMIVIEM